MTSPEMQGHANQPAEIRRPHVCCVGSGKGGTGKSVLAFNLARSLALQGLRVVLADLDLGGANQHILTGQRRCDKTLREFFGGQVQSLDDLLVPIDAMGLYLLPGSDEVTGVVQPGFQRKQKLIRHLRKLDVDILVCDLGGNSGLDTLDLFNEADTGLLITTPEPTSIQNTYGFAKAALLRKIWRTCPRGSNARELLDRLWSPGNNAVSLTIGDFIHQTSESDPESAALMEEVVRSSRYYLAVNLADQEVGQRVFTSLSTVARKFLEVDLCFLGTVAADQSLRDAIAHGRPPIIEKNSFTSRAWEQLGSQLEPLMAMGMNEEIRCRDEILHIQTEDLGPEQAAYQALVYTGGAILLSRRVPYDSTFFNRAQVGMKQDRVRFLHRTVVQAIQSGKIQLQLPCSPGEPESREKSEDKTSNAT